MLTNFAIDYKKGRRAEELVLDVFSSLSLDYDFEDVSAFRELYYCGDIKAVNRTTGKEVFIEVKNDGRIADTGNVLCETGVYFKKYGYYGRGNMSSNCDILVVVSEQASRIYVMDFKVVKEIYRKFGLYKEIEHKEQITECYLLELGRIKQFKGLIATIDYKDGLAPVLFSYALEEV